MTISVYSNQKSSEKPYIYCRNREGSEEQHAVRLQEQDTGVSYILSLIKCIITYCSHSNTDIHFMYFL